MLNNCIVTLGASYDDFNASNGDVHAVSPKTGVRCDLNDRLRLRLAALRSVKPALVTNRTVQPTQVAGFSQFYDDFNGAKAWLFGTGLDARPIDSLYTGVEIIYRELDSIIESGRREFSADVDEKLARTYIYWAPLAHWAISSGMSLDIADLENSAVDRLTTYTVPFSLNYFHPSGLFISGGPTYVWQDVQSKSRGQPEGRSDFLLIDASLGYRLPKRFGIASVSILNITNERVKYQDNGFRTPADSPALSPFIPERTIVGRLTLNF